MIRLVVGLVLLLIFYVILILNHIVLLCQGAGYSADVASGVVSLTVKVATDANTTG